MALASGLRLLHRALCMRPGSPAEAAARVPVEQRRRGVVCRHRG